VCTVLSREGEGSREKVGALVDRGGCLGGYLAVGAAAVQERGSGFFSLGGYVGLEAMHDG